MKRAISLILVLLIFLSLCACAQKNNTSKASTATVIVNNEEKVVTADDIINFSSRYESCPIAVTAKVVKIDGPRYFTSSLSPDRGYEVRLTSEFSDWCVHVGWDDEIINTIEIGDTVTVSAYIKDISNMMVCICGKEDGDMYPEYTKLEIVK